MTWSPRNRSEDGSDSIDGHGDGDGDSDKEDHNDTSSNLGNADDMDRLGVDRGLLSPGELSLIFFPCFCCLFVCLFVLLFSSSCSFSSYCLYAFSPIDI